MLQLKHMRYLSEMTNEPLSAITPVTFGYSITWSSVTTYTLASQYVPVNKSLIVLRVQSYLFNALDSASDFQFYRTMPLGKAWWYLGRDTSTSIQEWTNPNAPVQLVCDSDALVLFPENRYANIAFLPDNAAPAGTWKLRTTVYGYFVDPRVADMFSGPQEFINVQQ
jgi:hypothetical protein